MTRRHLTNYEAINNRKIFAESNYNFHLDDLEDKYSGIQIFDHFFMNLTKNGKPLIESFSFEVPDVVLEKNEENYFFNLMLFLAMQSHSLNVEERSYPIDFSYPKAERFIITLDLPTSFEVQQVPKDTSIVIPNGLGYYHYMVTGKGNQLQLHVKTEINTTFMNPSYYPYLKEFFDTMVSKETEHVRLIKNNQLFLQKK